MNRRQRDFAPIQLPARLPAALLCLALTSLGCQKQAPPTKPPGGGQRATNTKTETRTQIDSGSTAQPQEGTPEAATGSAAPTGAELTYPRDKDRLMAIVNGRNVTLEDIVSHIDSRHFKGFKHLVSQSFGRRELRIPRMADWTRQYADVLALRAETRRLGIKESAIQENLAATYLAAFGQYRVDYETQTQQPFPHTKKGVRALQARFLKSRGLGLEVGGLLDTLVPDELTKPEVIEFYNAYSESMNGLLNISQIFIQNRDRKTGALLRGEALSKAKKKLAEIKKLLAKDGSNFELIAASHSENQASARRSGILRNLQRFDPRLPAVLCGAAWGLRNGQWTGPIETRFGIHFVKRLEYHNTKMIINPDPDNAAIRGFVRSHRQERLLFKIRRQAKIELRY